MRQNGERKWSATTVRLTTRRQISRIPPVNRIAATLRWIFHGEDRHGSCIYLAPELSSGVKIVQNAQSYGGRARVFIVSQFAFWSIRWWIRGRSQSRIETHVSVIKQCGSATRCVLAWNADDMGTRPQFGYRCTEKAF